MAKRSKGGRRQIHRARPERIARPEPVGRPEPNGRRELVVITKPQAAFRASAGRFTSAAGYDVGTVKALLNRHGATLKPIFGPTEERVQQRLGIQAQTARAPLENLSRFYTVVAPAEQLEEIRVQLISDELVEAAYLKPPVALPVAINAMAPAPQEPPPATPDFVARQIYLDASPQGIDARWAWTRSGGRGRDIRIIDIEGNWRFTHEDLAQNQGGIVGGTPIDEVGWRNHGTAVLGEYSGDVSGVGISGICPDAIASAVSHGDIGSSAAIDQAAARLRAGDVMLLEMHRPGPRHDFDLRDDQLGYIAVEWWPDDFAAILNATRRGIIVIEAAGNGAEDLDDALYETPGPGFPPGWTNPFRRSNRDSGAIVVGAGAPPPGTHGSDHGPDRSRLDFSNWGALVDAQGWGREVTTCGYGDLQGGSNEDLWYTDRFSGTSSASPMVAGAVASIQGMAKARGRPVLAPDQIRNCLRATGAPQQDAPGRPSAQRIGNRPNLPDFAVCAFGKGKELTKDVTKEGKEGIKERKDTKEIGKDLVKEDKEVLKEAKEGKEINKEVVKEGKDTIKDTKEGKEKEKDFKEGKDIKEFKEGKEVREKDFKEKDKDAFEGKRFDKVADFRQFTTSGQQGGIEGRLALLEQAVGTLLHFIGAELRPDLSQSALRGQGDLAGGAEAAKQQKDMKDAEKLSDG